MSIGLLWLQCGGRNPSRACRVFSGKNGQFSAICDEGVRGQNCGPAGVGQNREPWPLRTWLLAENLCHVKQVRDGARRATRPERRKAASRTSSLPVNAPVCEAAARDAASERPALMTMIGFRSATSRAAERNDRASPTDSI